MPKVTQLVSDGVGILTWTGCTIFFSLHNLFPPHIFNYDIILCHTSRGRGIGLGNFFGLSQPIAILISEVETVGLGVGWGRLFVF